MRKRSGVVYIVAAVLLIFVGIITTTIIGAVKDNGKTTDIRAKAGATNTLKLMGTVSEINDAENVIIVTDVEFAPESRSGPAKNYGTWSVTPPLSFSLAQVAPGQRVTFTVETVSFNVATKKVAAVLMNTN